jgi:hypothetical protein
MSRKTAILFQKIQNTIAILLSIFENNLLSAIQCRAGKRKTELTPSFLPSFLPGGSSITRYNLIPSLAGFFVGVDVQNYKEPEMDENQVAKESVSGGFVAQESDKGVGPSRRSRGGRSVGRERSR